MPNAICPKCGGPADPDRLEQPCPACLLEFAARETGLQSSLPGPEPDMEAIRQAFPQLEILERIGRGGMGTVFKARQPKLDRFVAVKILSEKLAANPSFAERFAREGKLLATLNHPNIVAVYDYGEADGFFYLILEHVDGVNLRQAMREKRFTPEQAIGIVPKICDALQYAHEEGILHRDIKPENILLDVKGRVKIADFGIAGVARGTENGAMTPKSDLPKDDLASDQENEKLTETGQILGTPSYMAPEQLDDPNRVDHRADIYSLGVVFYELLTGELPKGDFPVPSEKTPVGAEVDEIVQKALQRERDKRYQSAADMKTHIETVTMAGTTAPINEEFPFFHDMLEFVVLTYSKHKTPPLLVVFNCVFLSFFALITDFRLLKVMAIGCIAGAGGGFIIQYLLFKRRRKQGKQPGVKMKTHIETVTTNLRSENNFSSEENAIVGLKQKYLGFVRNIPKPIGIIIFLLAITMFLVMGIDEARNDPGWTHYITWMLLGIMIYTFYIYARFAKPIPREKKEPQSQKDDQSPKRRNYAGWGCGLMVVWFVVFCMATSFWLTKASVSVQNEVVIASDANGKVVNMTPQELRGPSTFALVVGFVLLAAMIGLPILMTWLGWKHLRQIRTTDNKSGWLLGMFTALFFPNIFVLSVIWFIEILLLDEDRFGSCLTSATIQLFCVIIGIALSLLVIFVSIRFTYRFTFFKKHESNVKPSYGQRGFGLLVSATVILLTCFVIHSFWEPFITSVYQTNQRDTKTWCVEQRGLWECDISMFRTELEKTSMTQEKEYINERIRQVQEQLDNIENVKDSRLQTNENDYQMAQAILTGTLVTLYAIGILLAISGSIFGWCHLAKIRRASEKPGRVLGLITALLPVSLAMIILPAAILGVIFSLGDFGRNRDFATAVAALCGGVIGLIAAIFVIWRTCRWQGFWQKDALREHNQHDQPTADMKTHIDTVATAIPESSSGNLPPKRSSLPSHWNALPLWARVLLLVFLIYTVSPSLIMLILYVIDMCLGDDGISNGDFSIGDLVYAALPIFIFLTVAWLIHKHTGKQPVSEIPPQQEPTIPKKRISKWPIVFIGMIGLSIPYLAFELGARYYGEEHWKFIKSLEVEGVLFLLIFQLVSILPAIGLYCASLSYGKLLKYLTVICNYGVYGGFIFVLASSRDPQSGIAFVVFPFYGMFAGIGGYFLATIAHFVLSRR